jgi:iron complex outermembrane receptor protein
MKTKSLFLNILLFVSFLAVKAQEDTLNTDYLLELSFEELMNVTVEIASKKAEKIYNATFSTATISKQDIENSGVTSIVEALRLAPGVIVREQTNGIYDVHLMGFDYVIPRNSLPYTNNHTTLVMIDGRVVFRDFQGGTYWEALPISLQDVERIEIVRGPASALYGPNAVTGVINIITKRSEKQGIGFNYNEQFGAFQTFLNYADLSYKSHRLTVDVTANYQTRNRYQTDYYDLYSGTYVSSPQFIRHATYGTSSAFKNTSVRYPDTENALKLWGLNVFANYRLNDFVQFDLTAGTQESQVQKAYVDVIHTLLSTEESITQFVHFKADVYNFALQLSYLDGYQSTLGAMGWEYDFYNFDASLEYRLKLSENMSIVPGVSYRKVLFDDAFSVENSGIGFINGRYHLDTKAFSLRSDNTFFNSLRIIAALRADHYNYPQDVYISYNLAATYLFGEKHLLRVAASRANKGANILDTYIDFNFLNFLIYSGKKDLKLMTMDLYELGHRFKARENLHFDWQISFAKAKNYTIVTALDSVVSNPHSAYGITQYLRSTNVSVKPEQISFTFSANYMPNKFWQIKPFFTLQKTELVDYDFTTGDSRIEELQTIKNSWTPAFFGGLSVNYQPSKHWNFGFNTAFYSASYFYYLYDKTQKLSDKAILNFKINYSVDQRLSVFLNCRNITLGSDAYQFAFTDKIKPIVLTGVKIAL